jgi:hypothetical protein
MTKGLSIPPYFFALVFNASLMDKEVSINFISPDDEPMRHPEGFSRPS